MFVDLNGAAHHATIALKMVLPVRVTEHYIGSAVRTNGQCQRQNGDDCESGRLAQHAEAEAHILYQSLDKITAERLAAFLFKALTAAELDARAPCRLGAIHAGTFQIVSAVLDV